MLASLHALILTLAGCRVPVLVAVRGSAWAAASRSRSPAGRSSRRRMRSSASLRSLGVFAPAAACLLPWRVSAVAEEDLLRQRPQHRCRAGAGHRPWCRCWPTIPVAAALAYFDEHLAPRSAAALAHAMQPRAHRAPAAMRDELARVERLYLQSLMKTRDANEGLAAFLAKRSPTWEHR